MASLKFVLRENKVRKDGTCPLFLRVIEDRKARFVSTSIYLDPKHWNADRQEVRRTHELAVSLNDQLSRISHEALSAALSHRSSRRSGKESDAIVSEVKGTPQAEVYGFVDTFAERLHHQGRFWSWKRIGVIKTKLRAFCGNEPLTFADIDTNFLGRFEQHMRVKLKNHPNTIAKDMQVLRRIISEAIKDRLIEPASNPFIGYKITGEKTIKAKLSSEQIQALDALSLETGSALAVTRDAFLFSFYCAGIRFGDLCQLEWSNVVGPLGEQRLEYRMSKTGRFRSIKLLPQALRVLERYRPAQSRPGALIFPILNQGKDRSDPIAVRREISSRNVVVNKNLKRLATMAEIEVNVSFHVSRHSFADFARRSGVGLYDIMQMLAHHSLKVTERYFADADQGSMDSEMERIFATTAKG